MSIAVLKRRHDADAFDAADDGVAFPDVAQLAARRLAAVDHDRRVHALVRDRQPLASAAHVRFVVRRRVEIGGRASVEVGDARHDVLLADDQAAERHQVFDNRADGFFGVGGHAHPQQRRLVVGLADREAHHLERGVVPDDRVENAVQDAGVDEMSGCFDDFRCHGSLPPGILAWRRRRAG